MPRHRLPRFKEGEVLTTTKLNQLVDWIERAANMRFVGAAADLDGPGGRTVVISPTAASGGSGNLAAKTIGRHDKGAVQPVALFTETAGGDWSPRLDASNNPITVKAVNQIANLAGGVKIYISDLIGTATLYDIISGNPCDQGDTGGPTA